MLFKLLLILGPFIESRSLGKLYPAPVDVILGAPTIVQPDLVFVAADQLDIISARGIEGAPTLLVEIISPTSAQTDRHTKRQVYARCRVPFNWIVDPAVRTIDAYALEESEYRLRSAAQPTDATFGAAPFGALQIELARVWA